MKRVSMEVAPLDEVFKRGGTKKVSLDVVHIGDGVASVDVSMNGKHVSALAILPSTVTSDANVMTALFDVFRAHVEVALMQEGFDFDASACRGRKFRGQFVPESQQWNIVLPLRAPATKKGKR